MSKAIIRNGQIIRDTDAEHVKPSETAARESRADQVMRHRKDILQPMETDYWKAYPEKAKDLSPELRRLLS